MTTEVAIMNKHAIALAADSALTLSSKQGSNKIFNTVNKTFTLSKYYPVGIMTFGSAELLGLPWEILIKSCRDCLRDKSFKNLEEYSDYFIEYLKQQISTIPSSLQKDYFLRNIYFYLKEVFEAAFEKVQEDVGATGKQLDKDVGKTALLSILQNRIEEWGHESSPKELFSDDIFNQTLVNARNEFPEILKKIFGDIGTDEEVIHAIKKTLFLVMSRARRTSNLLQHSGIVIAGYGVEDLFPRLEVVDFYGIIADNLIYEKIKLYKIGFDNEAVIVPFAQSDMISTFVEGVDPFLNRKLREILYNKISDLRNFLLAELEDVKLPEACERKLSEHMLSCTRNFNNDFEQCKREYFIDPMINIVANLPIPELAQMAETLVSLTSFKRKMSVSEETVGGPIDVAVISKGDGFIWIKRKHYFNPELNHSFFKCYYPFNHTQKEDE